MSKKSDINSSRILDVFARLSTKIKNESITLEQVELFLRKENPFEEKVKPVGFLNKMTNSILSIGPTSGNEKIEDNQIFCRYDLRRLKGFANGPKTNETKIDVYEIVKSGFYTEVFTSISLDLAQLCLTEGQIVKFFKKYEDWFPLNKNVLFLFFMDSEFYVFSTRRITYSSDSKFRVSIRKIGKIRIGSEATRHLIIVPSN